MTARPRPQTTSIQQTSTANLALQPARLRLSTRQLARGIAALATLAALVGYGSLSWYQQHQADVDEEQWDSPDTIAAVEEILASRPYEPQIRSPLSDLSAPSSDHCGANMPSGYATREIAAAETTLAKLFWDANGHWASDAREKNAVAQAAGDGPPAACGEATYGEITVAGLKSVLLALARLGDDAQAQDKQQHLPQAFDAVLDLGAGVGRTAAAAVLLGLANRAYGVELGPQRFALGCRALARAEETVKSSVASQDHVELILGDARTWPELASKHRWPVCGSGWALYLGAQCFRDALLDALAQAIVRGCAPGARVAVLGRPLPTSSPVVTASTAVDSQQQVSRARRVLRQQGITHAKTTWAASSEVFLYHLVEELP